MVKLIKVTSKLFRSVKPANYNFMAQQYYDYPKTQLPQSEQELKSSYRKPVKFNIEEPVNISKKNPKYTILNLDNKFKDIRPNVRKIDNLILNPEIINKEELET